MTIFKSTGIMTFVVGTAFAIGLSGCSKAQKRVFIVDQISVSHVSEGFFAAVDDSSEVLKKNAKLLGEKCGQNSDGGTPDFDLMLKQGWAVVSSQPHVEPVDVKIPDGGPLPAKLRCIGTTYIVERTQFPWSSDASTPASPPATPAAEDVQLAPAQNNSKPTAPNASQDSSSDLQNAFNVAFGQNAVEQDGNTSLTFKPAKLVTISENVYALFAEGTDSTGDACNSCHGKLRITYLTKSGSDFSLLSPAVGMDIDGKSMGGAPDWKISASDGDNIVTTEEGWQMEGGDVDCSIGVYHLRPDGIVMDVDAERTLKLSTKSDCQLRR